MALVPEGGPVSGAAGKYAAQSALKKAAGGKIHMKKPKGLLNRNPLGFQRL